jgi:hypothetical protein
MNDRELPDDPFSRAAHVAAERAREWIVRNDAAIQSASRMLNQAARASERVQERLSLTIANLNRRGIPELIENALRAADRARAIFEASFPGPWRDLDGEELEAAFKLAADGVLCSVWAPRADVLRAILATDTDVDRDKVIAERRAEIIEDVQELLAATTVFESSEHEQAHKQAVAAVRAAESGHDEAAQALTAAALGWVVHGVLGFERLGAAFKAMNQRDPEEAGLQELRHALIERATVVALTDTKDHANGFNRHGTLHGDPAFYGPAQMLSGLLLISAWTHELGWWAARQLDEAS